MNNFNARILTEIKNNFQEIINWKKNLNNFDSIINSSDLSLQMSISNFCIIWLNSINEILFEKMILYYFEEFHINCSDKVYRFREMSKIDNIIKRNNNATYNDGLMKMLREILFSVNINDAIKMEWWFSPFNEKIKEINEYRNSIWHDSNKYFNHWNMINISHIVGNFDNYISWLQDDFKKLAHIFEKELDSYFQSL